MSINGPETKGFEPRGNRCFFCGDRFGWDGDDEVLYWSGHHPLKEDDIYELWLHPACFTRLATRLFRDLHEYDTKRRRPDEL